MTFLAILAVGAATGFLGGLFGKGGSAIATPVLAALGIPPIIAVASPLPATIPGTLVAAREYASAGLLDRRIVTWCAAVGMPATIAGAVVTRWVDAGALVAATEVIVVAMGLSILLRVGRARAASGRAGSVRAEEEVRAPDAPAPVAVAAGAGPSTAVAERTQTVAPAVEEVRARSDDPPSLPALVGVAVAVGFLAGLLANSGGFLLAPLLLLVLRLPVRTALGTSLVVSAALAVPGTLTHAALGHLDLSVVVPFALASVPLSGVGARCALRLDPERLELAFGAGLVVVGTALLVAV